MQYQTTTDWQEVTTHGLLVAAYEFAQRRGVFRQWERVRYKLKTVRYRPLDKLKTLWASVVVGCHHTVEINQQLGAHEPAVAAVFGLKRFPDQSQVNRLLAATSGEQVQAWRESHQQLLQQQSRAKARHRWLKLSNRNRLLVADIDQRAVVVNGKQFELAKPGYFGRKRGHRGYQLTVLFLGGSIGEVVDEYFDPGDTPIGHRVPALLQTLSQLCQHWGLAPEQVLIRGDAQLGTPALIAQVQASGFHYLFKGLSPQRAKTLVGQAQDVFWRVKPDATGQTRWMSDLGVVTHRNRSQTSRGQTITARTLVQVRTRQVPAPKPGQHRKRRSHPTLLRCHDYYLTDLDATHLPIPDLLPIYDDRATIERYFYDEQYALGARHVRTHHFDGAALFQFVVATTNNLLRWLQHSVFRHTELEQMGLGRLVRQAMHIPARLFQQGRTWIVQLPQSHYLVNLLRQSWKPLNPAALGP